MFIAYCHIRLWEDAFAQLNPLTYRNCHEKYFIIIIIIIIILLLNENIETTVFKRQLNNRLLSFESGKLK